MDHDSALYRPGLERSNCRANAPAKLSLSYATFAALMTLPLMTANAEQTAAIVRTPDGKPADKATVVMADTGSIVSVSNGEIVKTEDVIFRRQTDSAGRVDLAHETRPARPIRRGMARRGMGQDDSWLVVVHPSGFARVKCKSNIVPENIPLAPWVRIEGTCRVAGKSVPTHLVRLTGTLTQPPWIWSNGSAKTGASGRFVIEGLMDGHASLIESNDDDYKKEKERTEPVSSTFLSMILIAGQTRRVDFGATGRPVIGQLRHPADSKENAPWSSAMIVINPDIRRPVEGSISFVGRVDRDGNFSIHDVPPGRYTLDVRFSKRTPDQLRDHHFTVSESDEKLALRPVDLGVLTLTPVVPRPARVMKAR